MSISTKPGGICVIVFSKNRPLQLDATLRSLTRHCRDAEAFRWQVLYCATSSTQQVLYRQLAREHPRVVFVEERDFRKDLLGLLQGREHVLFVMDDNIFVRDFRLGELAAALRRQPEALGFSLRLRRNTGYCYSLDQPQPLPAFQAVGACVVKFRWPEAALDFTYPLDVSSSLYRLADLLPLLKELPFTNPNSLEVELAGSARRFAQSHPLLLCPPQSLAFCVPANKVQQLWPNRSGANADYSVTMLACRFADGQRIVVEAMDDFTPNACHQEVDLDFVTCGPRIPLISVVIPCFKQAQYLPEAVESVVQQTFTAWELIIVNDGSPDNTTEVARELIARYPGRNIRLVDKLNSGLSDARNAGIRAASGEYLLPLDADDRVAPTFLAKTFAVLDSQPAVGFAYSHIQHFGVQEDLHQLPEFDPETLVHTDNGASVCGLVRRTAWEQVGGYNADMREGYEDWDFWVGCIEKGWQGYRIPEPLFLYRKREGTMLGETRQKRERLIARIILNHRCLYAAERVRRAEALLERGVLVEPRRILLVCTHFWPCIGGLETVVENLGSRLVKRGYQVTVATLRQPERCFSQYRGMEIVSLEPEKLRDQEWPGAHPQIGKLVTSGHYDDCLLFADPLNWVLWSIEKLTLPASVRVLAQPIINADGYALWKDNREFRARLIRLLKRLNTMVVLSTDGQEVRFLREEGIPFVYLPNAVETPSSESAFRQQYEIPRARPLLLHVANLWPVKNHLGLLRALSFLPGDWRLVMIGHPSTDKAYVHAVQEAVAADPRFLLIPGLPRKGVASAMAAADVVLLASHGEVSPVTLLEAMSHGKPWVATPECGAACDNAGGLVVPLERFPGILCQLIAEPETARELGRLGHGHWKACFGWDRVAAAWEEVILTGQTKQSFEMPPHIRAAMGVVRQRFARADVPLTDAGTLCDIRQALAKAKLQALGQPREGLDGQQQSRPWPNRMMRRVVSKKLRRSVRKRLAAASRWFED